MIGEIRVEGKGSFDLNIYKLSLESLFRERIEELAKKVDCIHSITDK